MAAPASGLGSQQRRDGWPPGGRTDRRFDLDSPAPGLSLAPDPPDQGFDIDSTVPEDDGLRVLLVTARMGAGHTGVAHELGRRLSAEGCLVETVDFLDWLPRGLGRTMQSLYRAQLRHAPWTYDLLYRLRFRYSSAWRGIDAVYTRLARRRLETLLEAFAPDAIVSLYPLGATVLAGRRQRGRLRAAALTFITDLGVHPLWVHPGADRHLCVHEVAAAEAERRTGVPSGAPGPVVREAFASAPAQRRRCRTDLGIDDDERVVLVSGGSWGIGDLAGTVRVIAGSGRYTALVLCGNDERLARQVRAAGGRPLGWTDDMAGLLGAVDALVDNAGGLTCMEAFAASVPVISYRPIAGHGRHNAAEMVRAGVAVHPRSAAGLLAVLERVTVPGPHRDDLIGAAGSAFVGDATKEIVDAARRTRRLGPRVVTPAAAAPGRGARCRDSTPGCPRR
jgi:UDP-N-acetylglucosamine:LPS N-acetylglucosamine transferase